jgi:hypothetical protein
MSQRSISSIAALILISSTVVSAGTIADFNGDFTPVTFATGWQYLRNTGTIGTSANYTPLLWDPTHNIFDVDGMNVPAPGLIYTLISSSGGHPGKGTSQGAAFNGYAIAAYTIQPGEAGFVSLVNGSIRGGDPNGAGGASNGWDLKIYVGNTQSGPTLVFPWSSTAAGFSQALGALNVGDTVYVALGPNGVDLFDSALLQFQLNSTQTPEPGSAVQIGLGLLSGAALLWRRKRR